MANESLQHETIKENVLDSRAYKSLDDGSKILLRDGGMPMSGVTGGDESAVHVYDQTRNEYHKVHQASSASEAQEFVANYNTQMKGEIVIQDERPSSTVTQDQHYAQRSGDGIERSPFRSYAEQHQDG